jgi:hypothetical protein
MSGAALPTGSTLSEAELQELAEMLGGGPPHDFNERILTANKLARQVLELAGCRLDAEFSDSEAEAMFDRSADLLLTAACMVSVMRKKGDGESLLAFVQRAKQVASWFKRPIEIKTLPRELQQAKALEIARRISKLIWRHEGFLLILFEEGVAKKDSFFSYISSAKREDMIALLRKLLNEEGRS